MDQEANTIRLKAEAAHNIELVEVLESLGKKPESSEINTFYYVPHNRCKQFFGREAELSSMQEKLTADNSQSPRCVLLHGLGGMGKSGLAMEYIERHRQEFGAIIWLPADNEVKIQQALTEVASQLDLVAKDCSDTVQVQRKVAAWLSELGIPLLK